MASLMNTAVRMYLKRFDHEMHLMRHDPMVLQRRVIHRLSRSQLVQQLNPKYKIGYDLTDYVSHQPVAIYADYRDQIERSKADRTIKCAYYAQSSGTTTGQSKHIPTPESFVRANHLRGSWYNLHTLHAHNEDINVFKSKNLLIGGSIYERTDQYQIGDVSGIMIHRIPSFFRPYYVPSIEAATSPGWEEKLERTAQEAVKTKRIALTGGVPTWVLTLFRRIIDIAGVERVSDLWPDLRAYLHGGVSLSPYREEFEQLIDIDGFRYLEIYNATEGFFAFQDEPDADGMLLMTGAEVYYEFVERSAYCADVSKDSILSVEEISVDTDYVMLITTGSGLIRYVIGDVVRFVSLRPLRLRVVGRVGDYINAFGEDLALEHAESALMRTLSDHDASVMHYTVAPRYVTITAKGRHQWFIEFDAEPTDIERFASDLDTAVQRVNSNYSQKRTGSIALNSLEVIKMPKGSFKRYIQKRGRITGQSKIKKLSNNRSIADELLTMLDMQT